MNTFQIEFNYQGSRRWTLLAACILAASVLFGSGAPCLSAKEISIDLRGAQREPLVEVVSPPMGSPDRVSFTNEGMVIDQKSGTSGEQTGVGGFKMLLAHAGDFRAELEAKILTLEEPTQGWGQGLIFTILLNDRRKTQIKLNQVIYPRAGRFSSIELTGRDNSPPTYQTSESSFTDGSLIIERKGDKAIFSLKSKGTVTELATLDCPTADVSGVEVWSPRQTSGNTATKIALQKLTITADSFHAYQHQTPPWLTWRKILIGGQIALILLLLGIIAMRKRK